MKYDTKHKMKGTSIYLAWINMRQRVKNPNHPDYKYYGGKGITICDRWGKFSNFLEDMGIPLKGLTLDRLDNSKGYSPTNCRWATKREQWENRTILVRKLDKFERQEIRRLYKTYRIAQQVLADIFRINQTHVSRVINNKIIEDRE